MPAKPNFCMSCQVVSSGFVRSSGGLSPSSIVSPAFLSPISVTSCLPRGPCAQELAGVVIVKSPRSRSAARRARCPGSWGLRPPARPCRRRCGRRRRAWRRGARRICRSPPPARRAREVDVGALGHGLLEHALEIGREESDVDGPALRPFASAWRSKCPAYARSRERRGQATTKQWRPISSTSRAFALSSRSLILAAPCLKAPAGARSERALPARPRSAMVSTAVSWRGRHGEVWRCSA